MTKSVKNILYNSILAAVATFRSATANVSNDCDCTDITPVVLGCTNTDPPTLFTVTYPFGEMECESVLTFDQAWQEPTVTISTQDEVPSDEYYTILLVDTAPDSPVHPILHYGASNIPANDIINTDLILSNADPFSDYRGPDPPLIFQNSLFNYEWILAKQSDFVNTLPPVFSTLLFDFEEYLSDVDATVLTTQYFSSGFCVIEQEPPCSTYYTPGSCSYSGCVWSRRREECYECNVLNNRPSLCDVAPGCKISEDGTCERDV